MLGNSSQQPELGHFTLEWALNSSFHWFIRGSWEQETRETQLSEKHGSLGCVPAHPQGRLEGHMGPLITPAHPFSPSSYKVDPGAVLQHRDAPSSKMCWDRCHRALSPGSVIPRGDLPCWISQGTHTHTECSQPGWGINQARSCLGDLTTPHFIQSLNHPLLVLP